MTPGSHRNSRPTSRGPVVDSLGPVTSVGGAERMWVGSDGPKVPLETRRYHSRRVVDGWEGPGSV